MTSSYILDQINKSNGAWTYALPNSPLGGLEDSYLKIDGVCHPDFVSVPIGNPYGTKMCVRKVDPAAAAPPPKGCGTLRRIGDHLHDRAQYTTEQGQGYRRASVNLYDPMANYPDQEWNPDFYSSRRVPWEGQLLRRDYLRYPLDWNGTGIKTKRTPMELRDKDTKYLEYEYAFTPNEDPDTGKRVATRWSQTVPPAKYDLTHLYQPYLTFKNEHNYMGRPQDFRDTTYFERIV